MTLWSTSQPANMWLEFRHAHDNRLRIMLDILRVRSITEMETATRIVLDNGDPYDVHEDYDTVHRMLIEAINRVQA